MDDQPLAPVVATDATAVGDRPSFTRTERSWLVPALLVSLVAIALGLAWVLIGGSEARRDLIDLVDRVRPGGQSAAVDDAVEALPVVAASDFDPQGDDQQEHPDEVPNAYDGDLATAWTTETYRSQQDFSGLKDGVGIVLDLGEVADVRQVLLTTTNEEWSASIYVGGSSGATIAEWGEPATNVTDAGSGETPVDLDADGRYVLVWITDLGDRSFELQEAVVRGR